MSAWASWPSWSTTEALAFSGVPVTCTPEADWASAYAQERLFKNITQTQSQNNEEIVPATARDGSYAYLTPSRVSALVEGRGCARGLKDEYIGAAGEASLPSLGSLGYSLTALRPEIAIGTTFEGKAHGDDRECPIELPFQISDVPENLFLAPENEYELMRKEGADRLRTVLTNMARQKIEAFRALSFQ